MKANNLLSTIIGMVIGVILGGFTAVNGACNSKEHYDDAVRELIATMDEDYVLDVLVETDAWSNLSQYVDLGDY